MKTLQISVLEMTAFVVMFEKFLYSDLSAGQSEKQFNVYLLLHLLPSYLFIDQVLILG